MNNTILIYYLVINVIAFFVMLWDKLSAIKSTSRVPEKELWLLSLMGGVFGIFIAGRMSRHKTKKKKFVLGIPLLMLAHMGLLFYVLN